MRVRASVPSQYPGVIAKPSNPGTRAVVDATRREPAPRAHRRSSLALKQCAHDILDQLRGFDLLLTATVLRPAVAVGWQFHGGDVATPVVREELLVPLLTLLANAGGQPALTVPLQRTADGLPVGVQLIGRHGSDGGVLGAGKHLERARPDAQWQKPPLEVPMCV
jgi:Asp-tRNA(Asn)/Glu-tRNA(Gln) amidotransferase A subunit family amidase